MSEEKKETQSPETAAEAIQDAEKAIDSGETEVDETAPDGAPAVEVVTEDGKEFATAGATYTEEDAIAHIGEGTPAGDVPETSATESVAEEDDGIVETSPFRMLAAGTKVQMGNETVVLSDDAEIRFEKSEQAFVGMLVISENLDANRHLLDGKYDGLGNPITE